MPSRSGFDAVLINSSGVPMTNIAITVLNSDGTEATIYQSKTGNTIRAQPIVTNSSNGGLIQFWANPGYYQVRATDLNVPARIATRFIPFDAVAGDMTGGIDVNQVSLNNQITNSMIQNNAVTTGKIADSQVTTSKINDSAVTASKLGSEASSLSKVKLRTYFANGSASSAGSARVSQSGIVPGTYLVIATLSKILATGGKSGLDITSGSGIINQLVTETSSSQAVSIAAIAQIDSTATIAWRDGNSGIVYGTLAIFGLAT